MFKGKSLTTGIGIGRAQRFQHGDLSVPRIKCDDIDAETHALDRAVTKAIAELKVLKVNLEDSKNETVSSIFEAQIHMVKDIEVMKAVKTLIQDESWNVAAAYDHVMRAYIKRFEALPEGPFQERAKDIIDVKNRVLGHLLNETKRLPSYDADTVLFADDLSPSILATLKHTPLQGIVLERGGLTSHAAILAKTFAIPVLIHVEGVMVALKDGMTVIVDALAGHVLLSPNIAMLKDYQQKKAQSDIEQAGYRDFLTKPTQTADGHAMPIAANLLSKLSDDHYHDSGAEGVGLLRTEFLFESEEASQATQIATYETIFEVVDDIVVRTFDLGADKAFFASPVDESNPQLGLRGIRLALKIRPMFERQLRALLIAAAKQPVLKLMFPMVATPAEYLAAKAVLHTVLTNLEKENIPYQKNVSLGIMVEIPSAAMALDTFAPHVDFFSIGTNDLMQYFFAADRDNPSVNDAYDGLDPTFLALLKHCINKAHAFNKPVSVCGELAADKAATLLLCGLGVDSLSVSMPNVLPLRALIATFDHATLVKVADEALLCPDAKAVRKRMAVLMGDI